MTTKCGLVNLTRQSLSLGFPGQSMAEGGKGEKQNRAENSNQGFKQITKWSKLEAEVTVEQNKRSSRGLL